MTSWRAPHLASATSGAALARSAPGAKKPQVIAKCNDAFTALGHSGRLLAAVRRPFAAAAVTGWRQA